jgi:hypothetical protein
MKNSEKGTFRARRFSVGIVAVFTEVFMISGCQYIDTASTNSVFVKPLVSSLGSPARPVQAAPVVRSPRSDQPIEIMSTSGASTEGVYPFVAPRPVKVPTVQPVVVSLNLSDDGPLLGSSPYICSPSGFGQLANCHARLY